MKKVLILDDIHDVLSEMLNANGFVCEYNNVISYNNLYDIIENYTGIVVRSRITLDKEILKRAKKLKFIGRIGAGMESIDTVFAEKHGIKCFNSPEGSRDAVGEQTVGMLLSLIANINKSNYELKKGKWLREENRGIELCNKTVGIIGYGNMGSAVAKKLSGFNCNVISYDKYKKNYSDGFTKEVSINSIYNNADVVSLHVPLTNETKYMVNQKFIAKFKKPIILINTSRGPVVNTLDLLNSIKNKKIIGACLDVIEYEETSFDKMNLKKLPVPFYKLLNLPNVIITPHTAGWTVESKYKLAKVLAEKIIKNKF